MSLFDVIVTHWRETRYKHRFRQKGNETTTLWKWMSISTSETGFFLFDLKVKNRRRFYFSLHFLVPVIIWSTYLATYLQQLNLKWYVKIKILWDSYTYHSQVVDSSSFHHHQALNSWTWAIKVSYHLARYSTWCFKLMTVMMIYSLPTYPKLFYQNKTLFCNIHENAWNYPYHFRRFQKIQLDAYLPVEFRREIRRDVTRHR